MTQEQASVMKRRIDDNFYSLNLSKKEYFNNEWSEEFKSLFWDSRDKLIYLIEDILLNPEISINPLYRKFNPKDEHTRQEIKDFVSEEFIRFKEKNS